MLNTREKLIGLLYEAEEKCEYTDCGQCEHVGLDACGFRMIADTLIANGVTFAKDTDVLTNDECYKKALANGEKKLKVLELFAGTRSIGKAFEESGHEVYSIDWDKSFPNIDWNADIGKITAQDILERFGRPDVIWASPDCTTFSIAAISHHRFKGEDGLLYPKSEYAKQCDEIDTNVMRLIEELNPKYWLVENPRCGMRKSVFMQKYNKYRHTITYCQYGDTRMKPTDIWTNHPDPKFKPMCKNGDPCHTPAPRGAKTGTQGLKGAKERSVIPVELCRHIVKICEEA